MAELALPSLPAEADTVNVPPEIQTQLVSDSSVFQDAVKNAFPQILANVPPSVPVAPVALKAGVQPPVEPVKSVEQEAVEVVDKTSESTDPIEKQLKESQSMIGKQSNEIGELRKQLKEMQDKLQSPSAIPAQTAQQPVDEIQTVHDASIDDVKAALRTKLDESKTPYDESWLDLRARQIKLDATVKLQERQLAQLNQVTESQKRQVEVSKKGQEFQAAHPELASREKQMIEFLESAYPGVRSVDELTSKGIDPFQALHLAYAWVGKQQDISKSAIEAAKKEKVTQAAGSQRPVGSVNGAKGTKEPADMMSTVVANAFPQYFKEK